jgi:hypothetical protein
MPTIPSPGRGLVISGLNKEDGWGSRNASGQVIAGRAGDQGINHAAGLNKAGLDTVHNPIVTNVAESAVTATGATITWTTSVSQPNGQVYYQRQGAQEQVQLETGGPRTAHTVTLATLTAGSNYRYVIYQPATGTPPPGKTEAAGTFLTPLVAGALGAFPDTTGTTDSQDLMSKRPAPNTAFEVSDLRAVNVAPTEATIQWRSSVYADGTVSYRLQGAAVPDTVVEEVGVKRLNHSVDLFDLRPGATYRVAVVSADASGNLVEGGPITFTTPAS